VINTEEYPRESTSGLSAFVMDLVEFGLMIRIFLSAGTILSVASIVEKIKNRVNVALEEKSLREGVLSTLHAPVFALLDINDQEASTTASFGSSRTSPLLLAKLLRGCFQQ
jgi:hypothetical protein